MVFRSSLLLPLLLATVLLTSAATARAASGSVTILPKSSVIEGHDIPDIVELNGVQLLRNGHGIRSITFFGMQIKVYVAGLYTSTPLLNEGDVLSYLESGTPMQLDFTFLRSVGQSRVTSAWQQQLEHSVSHIYEGFEKDRDRFISMFGPISSGGTESVQLVGQDTVIIDQGKPSGTILGRDFQKSFLSMWFGEKAVAEDLKIGLLNGAQHHSIAVAADSQKPMLAVISA